jgi:hypothetical protein
VKSYARILKYVMPLVTPIVPAVEQLFWVGSEVLFVWGVTASLWSVS